MPAFYFDISPVGLALLVAGPLVLQYFFTYGIVYYTILAACYLTFVQGKKDIQERRAAIGLLTDLKTLNTVVDNKVLKHVLENMPGFTKDPSMEKCDWANKAFAAAFTYGAQFIGNKMQAKINQKLRNLKSIAEISLSKLSAGDVPPVCTGIKVHDYKNDLKIIVDCDVVWNGMPNVEVQVRLGGQGFNVEIYEMTLMAEARIVLAPLRVAATPIGTFGVSFRKMPYINFGMRIGGVEVMNLGAGPAQVATVIENAIRHMVREEFLYPNISWNQLDNKFDMKLLNVEVEVPCGLLSIHVISGKNLIVADITTSDPYLVLSLGTDEKKTKVINRTLNPVWNEHLVMLVHDLESQRLEIQCMDHDVIGVDDPMGRVSFPIGSLEYYQKKTVDLTLEGVQHGSIQLELQYIPLDADHSHSASFAHQSVSHRDHSNSNARDMLMEDSEGEGGESNSNASSTAAIVSPSDPLVRQTSDSSSSVTYDFPEVESPVSLAHTARRYSQEFTLRSRTNSSSYFDDAASEAPTDSGLVTSEHIKKQSLKSKVSHFITGKPRRLTLVKDEPHSVSTRGTSPSFSAVASTMLSKKNADKSNKSSKVNEGVRDIAYGVIVIEKIGCNNLAVRHKTLEARVQFKFEELNENEKKSTEIIHGTCSPIFKEKVLFVVAANQVDSLLDVKVKDVGQKNKTIGEVVVSVGDIIRAGGLKHHCLKIDPTIEESVVYFNTLFLKPSLKPRHRPAKDT